MHSSHEDIELCSIDRFGSIEPNRTELYTKEHKNNQKIRKSSGTVRRDKIELVRLSSVRFGSIRFENLFDSFTVCIYIMKTNETYKNFSWVKKIMYLLLNIPIRSYIY
jgi:hypothetical protein